MSGEKNTKIVLRFKKKNKSFCHRIKQFCFWNPIFMHLPSSCLSLFSFLNLTIWKNPEYLLNLCEDFYPYTTNIECSWKIHDGRFYDFSLVGECLLVSAHFGLVLLSFLPRFSLVPTMHDTEWSSFFLFFLFETQKKKHDF